MRIESLTPPLEEGGLWLVTMEDATRFRLDEGAVVRLALYSGMDADEVLLEQIGQAQTQGDLRRRAMTMLLRRSMSQGELEAKLLEKGASPEQAREICDWARGIGLLDDVAYAKSVVRSCVQRGYGIHRVKNELYRHKLPKELWDEALLEFPDPEEDIDRYLEGHLKDNTPKSVKKAADALARRGFSWGAISAGIRRWGEMED